MSINKTIVLNWDGEEHEVRITMGLIDRIEEDLNLMKFMSQVGQGDVRFSKAARLFSHLFNAAGKKLTQEQVYQGMFGSGQVDAKDVVPVLFEVFSVMFPEPPKKHKATPGKVKA